MADLADGESTEMKGSGASPYVLKNTGGVYSCSCPAWRNQSIAIEKRSCKHLRKLRGDAEETARVGTASATPRAQRSEDGAEDKGPPILLAEKWDGVTDLSGWWISEKLDGVRAFWDGGQFISRLGNRYHAPAWFCQDLPKVVLDGELWVDRKSFQRTVSIVRRQDQPDSWNEVKFLVFDAPDHSGPFEDRMAYLAELFAGEQTRALVHRHEPCRDLHHLREELRRVEELGGEGLMLRQPGSHYVAGRSVTLLKVKSFLDTDVVVRAHQAGAGKHKGRLGALLVEMADGTRFSVGTGFSDAERNSPPAIGSVVTVRYQELSEAGVPRFPSYVGVRHDVSIAPAPAVPASPPAPSAGRRFEFVGGGSSKFWEISRAGDVVRVRYGRIGSAGQTKDKTFPDPAAAERHTEKLIAEKTKEGYMEVFGQSN
jgi:DNA ligase-1